MNDEYYRTCPNCGRTVKHRTLAARDYSEYFDKNCRRCNRDDFFTVNDKHGMLTIMENLGDEKVKCKCDCGKTVTRSAIFLRKQIRRNLNIHCGCLVDRGFNSGLKGEELGLRQFWVGNYGATELAKKNRTPPDFEWFKVMVKKPCFYCGREPYDLRNTSRKNPVIANGIDRVDNDIGYTEENCVPCCKQCNYSKRSLSKDEFVNLAYLITETHNRNND